MEPDKSLLIVTGVAHSGVSTVAALLNTHAGICLGVQRFRDQYLMRRNFSPTLFTQGRFFDFQRADTDHRPDANPLWAQHYGVLEDKWPAARLVGDSLDDLTPVLPGFVRTAPAARFIFVLRNLKDVAMTSSEARDNGFARACEDWALQYRMLHDLMIDQTVRRRFFLLDYDQFLEEGGIVPAALLRFLDLDADPVFEEAMQRQRAFVPHSQPTGKIPAANVEIYKAVDQEPARALRKLARSEAELRVAAA